AVPAALGEWAGSGHAVEAPPAHDLRLAGIELVDRPGAVQSNIRLGGPAPARTDPDLAALRPARLARPWARGPRRPRPPRPPTRAPAPPPATSWAAWRSRRPPTPAWPA